MSAAMPGLAYRAAELRAAFDRAFAAPWRADVAARHDLIAIGIGNQACALRLADIAGLFADKKITPVPGGRRALLGIAGFRGALLPVFSLHTLLGLAGAPAPRWLVVAAAAPVALAFEAFDGHLRAAADAIMPRQAHGSMQNFAPDFVRTGAGVRPIIAVASVIAALDAAETVNHSVLQE